ncbi:MAG: thymidine phosphorylase [Actinomycetia bacterium]|nr:thymidine phosphorylase [Actinomycetes bacterium]
MSEQNPVDIIRAKRDGRRLDDDQISWFVDQYAKGIGVADEQASALAMAIFFQGLDTDELAAWTRAMIDSGARLDLAGLGRPTVDKHSTGGVGDKISLILVPLVAACGAAVPQLSGRGLGHTGGTLDKLEAIPGWRADLSLTELRNQLASIGGVIAAATTDLAPADRKLYALRDVTATVDSIPLIASSIMSKKIAEGTDALVLDVKTGEGAFMTEFDQARQLAITMVDIGRRYGVKTRALVTDMDNLLGRTAGNGLEVLEAIDVLSGGGPADIIELTLALANEMVELVGIDADPAQVLASGQALATFHTMIEAQGGDLSQGLASAPLQQELRAERAGVVTAVKAMPIGVAAWRLGAGRAHRDDTVSPTAGVEVLVSVGDWIEAGQPLLRLHAEAPERLEAVIDLARSAVLIGDNDPAPSPLIIDRIGR